MNIVAAIVALFLGGVLFLQNQRKQNRHVRFLGKTIVPIAEIPVGLSPLEVGLVFHDGRLTPAVIGGCLVALVDRRVIVLTFLKDAENKTIDAELQQLPGDHILNPFESYLLQALFVGSSTVRLSQLPILFSPQFFQQLSKLGWESVTKKELFVPGAFVDAMQQNMGAQLTKVFVLWTIGSFFLVILAALSLMAAVILVLASLVYFNRAPKHEKLTLLGKEVLWHIKGLHLHLYTAERYRHPFYEQENITDPFLPYSIALEVTPLWSKAMTGMLMSGFASSLGQGRVSNKNRL
jgi:hypothetical protein